MQVDFNKTINDIKKKPMINPVGDETTLGWIVQEALMSSGGDQDGASKIKKIRIALQIDATPVQEISADEIKMFIKLIEGYFGPMIYYRVLEILDPKQLDAKPKD